jgi:Tfp pilus assembly protein FimV
MPIATAATNRTAPHADTVGPRPVVAPAAVVYRRRRLVVLGLAVLVLALTAVAAFRPGQAGAELAVKPAPVVYVVRSGDTLWTIAARLAPGHDPRPLVAELKKIAGGASLQVGQRLELPAGLVNG